MRVLLLFRGAPGCGKSTFIEQNGLKPYTLSADEIRMMYSAPSLNIYGNEIVNPSNDSIVWKTLFSILEQRMQNGEFTVIDATNSKTVEMKRYLDLCSTYRYRIYCIDMTNTPIEVAKARNLQRIAYKQVPETAIDNMYARFATQNIPSGITVLKPDELDKIWYNKPMDLSQYKKIHNFGDIHGCYTALNTYFERSGGFKDDEFYIFVGDYCDRGIENAETLNFLLSIYKKPNVLLLEGNHEIHLWHHANDCLSKSSEFNQFTKPQIEAAGIKKKTIKNFYRKLAQCAYYTYNGNTYLVTHGGLSTLPNCLTTIATSQMIKGTGRYDDSQFVDMSFMSNTENNVYQIHGHRNTECLDTKVNERAYNLEGKVEFGGDLRVLCIDKDGHNIIEIENTVYKTEKETIIASTKTEDNTVDSIIESLRANANIQEKQFGNISSFNFTREAFTKNVWDEQTIKARGFYINTVTKKIVARSYDKFFNINQRPETKLSMLQNKLQFPVTAYVKENGFLGIVSYNDETDDLFITTKSNPDGDYANYLKAIINNKISVDNRNKMKNFSKENNISFVFECVDIINDPHIIEYSENKLFLLDVIYNEIEYRKVPYEELVKIGTDLGLEIKKRAIILNSWQEFYDWYYEVTAENYKYNNEHIEGFVIEDTIGYMVKVKLDYYNFWKFMRTIAYKVMKHGHITGQETSALTSARSNIFYGWLKQYRADHIADLDSIPKDIISLRRIFLKSKVM